MVQQVKAKKFLGQHFLTDLSIAQRIADTVSEYQGTPVLEIGPGMGVLTNFCCNTTSRWWSLIARVWPTSMLAIRNLQGALSKTIF